MPEITVPVDRPGQVPEAAAETLPTTSNRCRLVFRPAGGCTGAAGFRTQRSRCRSQPISQPMGAQAP